MDPIPLLWGWHESIRFMSAKWTETRVFQICYASGATRSEFPKDAMSKLASIMRVLGCSIGFARSSSAFPPSYRNLFGINKLSACCMIFLHTSTFLGMTLSLVLDPSTLSKAIARSSV